MSVLLVTAKGGHPPGLVLVPVVAAIWLAGHVFLWGSHKLAIRGKYLADDKNTSSGKWPLAIIFLIFIFGLIFFFGLFGILWQIFSQRDWLRGLAIPLAVWIPSSLCFFGIVLRHDWSRLLAGSGFIVLAIILLYEMIASFMRGYRNSSAEWAIAIVIFVLLSLFGQYVLRSSSIKTFFSKN